MYGKIPNWHRPQNSAMILFKNKDFPETFWSRDAKFVKSLDSNVVWMLIGVQGQVNFAFSLKSSRVYHGVSLPGDAITLS